MNLEGQVIQVNLDDIIPNRFQPRIAFDEKALNELASSIKEHGIIQPLVLRKLGKKYEIIAGERRYKAATLAGLTTVPAVISNIDDNSSAEVALVENIQRKDLTAIEEARSYKNLLDKGYLTQEQLAKKMGLSQSAISNKLRLLNLDNQVQQALLDGKISERHARALLSLTSKEEQVNWLNKIIAERITVKDLDKRLKEYLGENKENGDIPLVDLTPNIDEIKNNAADINNNKPKNIANLLVSEDTMTEYSDNLPTNNTVATQAPVETLESTSPAPMSLEAAAVAQPESLTPATSVQETPSAVEALDPFASILNTPQETIAAPTAPEAPVAPVEPAIDPMASAPAMDNAPAPGGNKFFNPLEDVPATLDNLSPFAAENVFNAQPEAPANSDIEIFDVASPAPTEQVAPSEVAATPMTEQPVIDQPMSTEAPMNEPIVSEPVVQEPVAPVQSSNTFVNPMDNPVEESPVMNELNPNNKFFQPIAEETPVVQEPEINVEDTLINPMDFVDTLDEKVEASPKIDNFTTALNDIRTAVSNAKEKGVNINIDEADLANSYQIIIQIEK